MSNMVQVGSFVSIREIFQTMIVWNHSTSLVPEYGYTLFRQDCSWRRQVPVNCMVHYQSFQKGPCGGWMNFVIVNEILPNLMDERLVRSGHKQN